MREISTTDKLFGRSEASSQFAEASGEPDADADEGMGAPGESEGAGDVATSVAAEGGRRLRELARRAMRRRAASARTPRRARTAEEGCGRAGECGSGCESGVAPAASVEPVVTPQIEPRMAAPRPDYASFWTRFGTNFFVWSTGTRVERAFGYSPAGRRAGLR